MAFATHALVPVDFSDASRLALAAAKVLAAEHGVRLTLLHVHDPGALRAPASVALGREKVADLEDVMRREVQEELDRVAADFAETAAETVIVEDAAVSQAIVREARERGCDLILIATHGRTGLEHLLIGSVAERVVRHAPCAVLTLRSRAAD
jgi:universal stress protein A